MRHGLWMIPLGGALILAGCGQSESGKKSLPEKVAETTRKAAEQTGKDLEQARREFQKEFENQMETLNSQIKTWQGKLDDATDEAKEQAKQQLQELQKQRDALAERFDSFRKDSGEAWEELKTGLEDGLKDLRSAFERARKKFDGS